MYSKLKTFDYRITGKFCFALTDTGVEHIFVNSHRHITDTRTTRDLMALSVIVSLQLPRYSANISADMGIPELTAHRKGSSS
jgi:hypothetical protein